MSLSTLNDIFFAITCRNHGAVMMHRQANQWTSTSANELYRNVVGVARALKNCGINKGDRVAILSENRPEWTIADFACLLIGAVVVPIYATLTSEQTAYILRDSEARAIFVSSEKQLEKVQTIRDQTTLKEVVVMDAVKAPRVFPMREWMQKGPSESDPRFDAAGRAANPDDLATIIYTSGTTGTPKGAMLTHGNMVANLNVSLSDFEVGEGEISISFLPLSHVTARGTWILLCSTAA
jgi:long-chain acyl-CoA synthetase